MELYEVYIEKDEQMDGRTHKRTDKKPDRRTGGQANRHTYAGQKSPNWAKWIV